MNSIQIVSGLTLASDSNQTISTVTLQDGSTYQNITINSTVMTDSNTYLMSGRTENHAKVGFKFHSAETRSKTDPVVFLWGEALIEKDYVESIQI